MTLCGRACSVRPTRDAQRPSPAYTVAEQQLEHIMGVVIWVTWRSCSLLTLASARLLTYMIEHTPHEHTHAHMNPRRNPFSFDREGGIHWTIDFSTRGARLCCDWLNMNLKCNYARCAYGFNEQHFRWCSGTQTEQHAHAQIDRYFRWWCGHASEMRLAENAWQLYTSCG